MYNLKLTNYTYTAAQLHLIKDIHQLFPTTQVAEASGLAKISNLEKKEKRQTNRHLF